MDAKMQGKVIVVPYDPAWKSQFAAISGMIKKQIGEHIAGIEHVGSTSVEGMAGKPIIDMDVLVESFDGFDEIKGLLGQIGFSHIGNEGVEGREVFRRNFVDEFMPYYLYVCLKDGHVSWLHNAFRDYLRAHPRVAADYAALKTELAKKYPEDIDGYFHEKSIFVEKVFADIRAGESTHE